MTTANSAVARTMQTQRTTATAPTTTRSSARSSGCITPLPIPPPQGGRGTQDASGKIRLLPPLRGKVGKGGTPDSPNRAGLELLARLEDEGGRLLDAQALALGADQRADRVDEG